MTQKVTTVVGARPQFIKAAPVSRALAEAGIMETLVHSGQHYDAAMSGRFFEELGIPAPAHNLGIGSGSHAEQTGQMLIAFERLMVETLPEWVMVYGDTNTTLAAALAAVKLNIPVAHVESGLRSGNMAMPEEINRIVTDRISRLLFAPTQAAVDQLRLEGVPTAHIQLTGDVMYDAALAFGPRAEATSRILDEVGLAPGCFILATIHRAENTDSRERLSVILEALGSVGSPVCLPLHPRTSRRIAEMGLAVPSQVRVIAPVGYLDMLRLLAAARLVVTDSGGVQKEAYFMGSPCVTVRTETEWTELVEAGWNRLAPPTSLAGVISTIEAALASDKPSTAPPFYGDGRASARIAEVLRVA